MPIHDASLEWGDVDREAGIIVARAKNVKNRRAHRLVLEGELAEIIERRWEAREYKAPSGPGTSKYVFHRNGKRISDPRRAWARACYDVGLPCEVVYKKDLWGKPVLHKRGPEKVSRSSRRSCRR